MWSGRMNDEENNTVKIKIDMSSENIGKMEIAQGEAMGAAQAWGGLGTRIHMI